MSNSDNSAAYGSEDGDFSEEESELDGATLMTIDEKKARVPQLYESGHTWDQIEEELGLNKRYIGEALREAGLTGAKKKRKPTVQKRTPPADGVPEFRAPKIPGPATFAMPKSGGSGDQKPQKIYEQPMRVLDDSYSQLTKHLTERIDWFVEALTKIGWSAMMISFQTAQISSSEAFERLDEFKDADQFVQFVNTYLSALWQAKDDAQALVKLEETNRHYDLLLFAAGERIKQLEILLGKAVLTARTALTCMNQDDLRRFTLASTFGELTSAQLAWGGNNNAKNAISGYAEPK